MDRKPSSLRGALRTLLIVLAVVDLLRAVLFLTQQSWLYSAVGRSIVDPVITRQYGIFLLTVALFYALLARDPERYARLLWVGVAQHATAAVLALNDLIVGDLSVPVFLVVLMGELLITAALVVLNSRIHDAPWLPGPSTGRLRWMRRIMLGFGVLFVFWAVASTIIIPLGSWLLNYPVIDSYTTKQQGIAFLVIGLSSLLAAADIRRYRIFIWVVISSQAFGCLNSAYEVFVGTIPLSVAFAQWSIQAVIVASILWLYPWKEAGVSNTALATSAS